MVEGADRPVNKVRFGVFEADLRTGELHKHGLRVHLQRQPFSILVALLERPGELVTREDLRHRIWGAEVVVDFDHSISTAVNKLREALGDSADMPRFVETLAKRGFRFIAPVQAIETPGGSEKIAPDSPALATSAPRGVSRRRNLIPLSFAAAALLGLSLLSFTRGPQPLTPVQFSQITSDYRIYPGQVEAEQFPGVVTDGVRVYFSDFQNGRVGLAYVLVHSGEVHRFLTPPGIVRPSVADISRDGSQLLIRSVTGSETEQPLWIMPATGGPARRVFDGLGHDAAWSPDSSSVLYASGHDLFLVAPGGGSPRKLATLPGRAYWMRYAPDGSAIRFTLFDSNTHATSLWQMAPDGTDAQPILSGWNNPPAECCGDWTPDGNYFVFQSGRGGSTNLWGIRERGFTWRRTRQPFEITAGPLAYAAPVPSVKGGRLFCLGAKTHSEMFHFDLSSGKLEPYLDQVRGAGHYAYAHRTRRVAWVDTAQRTLWRGDQDGTDRVQLTRGALAVYAARWSPDDTRLAVMAKYPGAPFKIYTVSSDGGDLQLLLEENCNQADPDWGPGGTAIVFGRLPEYAAQDSSPKDIRIVNLATKAVSVLPESARMFSPRWSPDGRYIAAMSLDQHRLMVFDRTTGKWLEVAEGTIQNPVWSRDGKYLYFQDPDQEDVPVFRVSIPDRRLERVCDRRSAGAADSIEFWGLALDGGPIVSLVYWAADVYGVNWNPGGDRATTGDRRK